MEAAGFRPAAHLPPHQGWDRPSRRTAVHQRRPLGNYHPYGEWLEWTDGAADHTSGAPSSR
jgi:hypothetical protein